jgi:hypothetical protein
MIRRIISASISTRFVISIVFGTAAVAQASQVLSEFILDDFDDPFKISLPQSGTSSTVTQFNVGPLQAERQTSFINILGRPIGQVDANTSRSSGLVLALDRLNPTTTDAPLVALNVNYFFEEIDATQGGANDRVVLDFAFLHSAVPLARVDVFMHDRQTNYVSQQFTVSTRATPFTLEFPFNSFSERGGGGTQFDPRHIHSLYFSIIPVYLTPIDEIDFSTVVNRIRLAVAVPEPSTSILVVCFVFPLMWSEARNRRYSHEEARITSVHSRTNHSSCTCNREPSATAVSNGIGRSLSNGDA